MTSPHYNKVREAVIKAVPDILKLEFGCEVLVGFPEYKENSHVILINADGSGFRTNGNYGKVDFNGLDAIPFEILGRPIRLTDVLVTLAQTRARADVTFDGDVARKNLSELTNLVWKYWNLREDDLSKQSPETLEFLASLLTPQ